MNYGIAFTPLVPAIVLWIALAAIVVIAGVLLLARARGTAVRVAALALFLLALANPSFTREDRDPLTSIAAVVVDKSPSQNFGNRNREAAQAQEALVDSLKKIKGLEVRVVEAGQADGETDGTRLFGALASALADVPVDRVAGAFLITDGRVHDIPPNAAALGFQAPVHALITGQKDERDRRIAVTAAPRFGIVGQNQTITYRLDDQGVSNERAKVTVRRDGEVINERTLSSGQTASVDVEIKHAGPNIVEIEASPLERELTPVNNRAVVAIDGVRDKLRVLLVSGEPHSGERTWRNLLKSDASVDLVHFTILRPPEKQDGTPINELSLIAFPTRELFQQKINEFQLIIFDRYARQGVLPIAYFDNIARYVRSGGAVLVSAGPDYASNTSIWRTPLDSVLPAEPVGVTEKPFYAHLSDVGKRHPVTRGLEGSASEPPHWSRFFRTVDTRNSVNPPVMTGADGKPLLFLTRFGEGRVALLLSDHIWLWARGYEGGGPHLDLLRRMSHWLMKQPDLDEEALRLQVQGKDLVVVRQTMSDSVQPVSVTSPSGVSRDLTLSPGDPGEWRASLPASELGLWQATDGTLKALINVGPTNPKEFSEVTSTTDTLKPLTQATGGDAVRVVDGSSVELPRIAPVRSASIFHGDGWMGVRMRDASVVKGVGVLPIFAGLIGLLLLLGAFAATWVREGR
ncbi:membrane protein [Bradyrhizobium sp. LTSP849]|uniref:membrane protein n=1 Tax=unclassified Bradyrhizobium TaxID=2631580 RepID=UPI0005D289C7|nr:MULTISPECIES: membrane protein [unclassified Bradyrhizobium]KJC43879.1 membrane protein [Bradyrhizobium sp. LTSP857]KJC53189.1 membrane protein [Bradyrhizobium sp. LTSP849]